MPDTWTPDFFRTVLDTQQTGVYVVDRQGKILLWNQGAERITGQAPHEVVCQLCRSDILANCNNESCSACGNVCPMGLALHEGRTKEDHLYLLHKAGHRIPVHLWNVPIRDEHGFVIAAAGSFETISGGCRTGLTRLAGCGCLDGLTGVGNRRFTEFHLRENLARFLEYNIPFGVVMVQIDQLDHWRATYGHEGVAAALGVVAETIRNTIRPTDFLGRWPTLASLSSRKTVRRQAWKESLPDFKRPRRMRNCSGGAIGIISPSPLDRQRPLPETRSRR